MVATGKVEFKDKEVRDFLNNLIKNINLVEKKDKAVWHILSAIAYQDVIDHFEKEKGPKGKWQKWSDVYRDRMIRKKKGNNKILQDIGTLRMGIVFPISQSEIRRGVLLFNQVPYARRHDEGDKRKINGVKMPMRKFFWISDKALDKMAQSVLTFLMKGKK